MSVIERAVEVIATAYSEASRMPLTGNTIMPHIAQALADAGLLLSDADRAVHPTDDECPVCLGLLLSDADRAVLDAARVLANRWIDSTVRLPPDIAEFVAAERARREGQ